MKRDGFSMVELLVVVVIISLIVTMSIGAIGTMIGSAKEKATRTTIQKINAALESRLNAFNREFERQYRAELLLPDLKLVAHEYMNVPPMAYSEARHETVALMILYKIRVRQFFPQINGDSPEFPTPLTVPDDPRESAENLYWTLVQARDFGGEDEFEFLTSEYADTDDDGRYEFIDAWGNPLRWYRWPTRLFDEWTAYGYDRANDNLLAKLLVTDMPGIKPPPSDLPGVMPDAEIDIDPEDLAQRLSNFPLIDENQSLTPHTAVNISDRQLRVLVGRLEYYPTPRRYHVPLIVSAGIDGELGLEEPTNTARFGYLGKWSDAIDPGATTATTDDTPKAANQLLDNVTNLN